MQINTTSVSAWQLLCGKLLVSLSPLSPTYLGLRLCLPYVSTSPVALPHYKGKGKSLISLSGRLQKHIPTSVKYDHTKFIFNSISRFFSINISFLISALSEF